MVGDDSCCLVVVDVVVPKAKSVLDCEKLFFLC